MRRVFQVMLFSAALVSSSLFALLVPAPRAVAAEWGQAAGGGIAGGYKPVSPIVKSQAVFGGLSLRRDSQQ